MFKTFTRWLAAEAILDEPVRSRREENCALPLPKLLQFYVVV